MKPIIRSRLLGVSCFFFSKNSIYLINYFVDFSKHKRMDFQNIKNLNLRAGTIFYVRPAKNLPWDQGEVIKKNRA